MSKNCTDAFSRNGFHGVAALGKPRLASKSVAQHSKKTLGSLLVAKDVQGRTPAHVAAYCGNLRVLILLLEACPEASKLRDQIGYTPIDALRRAIGTESETSRRLITWGSNIGGQLSQAAGDGFGVGEHDRLSVGHCSGELRMTDDVETIAISSNTLVALAKNDTKRHCHLLMAGKKHGARTLVDLNTSASSEIRASDRIIDAAIAKRHTIAISESSCWTWGAKEHGVLGYDCDTKIQLTPKRIEGTSFPQFAFDDDLNLNRFEALALDAKTQSAADDRKPRRAFTGCSACETHSVVHTETSIWSWGLNSAGQMLGHASRGELVAEPIMVLDHIKDMSDTIVSTAATIDWGIVVLTAKGYVDVLADGRITRLVDPAHDSYGSTARAIRAEGKYLVVQMGKDRLIRYTSKNGKLVEDTAKLWTARRSKDFLTAFDVAATGSVVISTQAATYTCEDENISLVQGLSGLHISEVRCDPQFKAFAAIYDFANPPLDVEAVVKPIVTTSEKSRWINIALQGESRTCSIPAAIVLGRCPTLRKRTDGSVVEFPSSSDTELSAFADACLGVTKPKGHGLDAYIHKGLGDGLWDAKVHGIATDVDIKCGKSSIVAHSDVLIQKSLFFRTLFEDRWLEPTKDRTITLTTSAEVVDAVVKFMYTGDIGRLGAEKTSDKLKVIQFICEVWQAGEELAVDEDAFMLQCQRELLNALDFELVMPLFEFAPSSSFLRKRLLDTIMRHMSYFVAELPELDVRNLDLLETSYKSMAETETFDNDDAWRLVGLLQDSQQASRQPSPKASSKDASPRPAEPEPKPKQEHTPPKVEKKKDTEKTGGWLPARRKSRPTSARPDITSPMATSSRPPTPASATPALTTPALAASASTPALATPSASELRVPSPRPIPSTSNSPSIVQSAASPLANLPTLGSLPTLGNTKQKKPRAGSTPRNAGPPPKLSQKERRRMQAHEDPFSETPSPGPSSSPWRTVEPQVSSRLVLEHLEKRKHMQTRPGTVWGRPT